MDRKLSLSTFIVSMLKNAAPGCNMHTNNCEHFVAPQEEDLRQLTWSK